MSRNRHKTEAARRDLSDAGDRGLSTTQARGLNFLRTGRESVECPAAMIEFPGGVYSSDNNLLGSFYLMSFGCFLVSRSVDLLRLGC